MTSQLFVITGSSGGGKSALLEELARRGYSVVPEAGRQLVREQQSIGGCRNRIGSIWPAPFLALDVSL